MSAVPLRRVRIIPTLLIDRTGRLVKTVKFGKRTYIGDPINAVKIFNRKEVDELVLLDIDATTDGRPPNYALIEDIVSEAFMPVGYGGGITHDDHIEALYKCGIEKVILSSCLSEEVDLIEPAAKRYGAQAIVACLPIKKAFARGQKVMLRSGTKAHKKTPLALAQDVVAKGAGEIIVYSIDRDGTYSGYDIDLIKQISDEVDVPVVACGGARNIEDFVTAIRDGGCSAVAAGSFFVYHSKTRGVLISYPPAADLVDRVFKKLALT